jgi:hypothetical protein
MSEGRKLNILEKAIRLIPGYKGYKGKEERRDNDHLFRMMLVARLEKLRTVLGECTSSMKGPGALAAASEVDRVGKRLEKATDEVRFADRGYRGWFDMHKVREDELDRLYEFDIALVEDVGELEKAFEELSTAAASGASLTEASRMVVECLIEFSNKVGSRSGLMIDLEKNTPID